MRKVTIALVTIAIIAGGGAWYVLSYLPGQIQSEIEATIASLKPDLEITFGHIEIDVLDERAVLGDVFVRSPRFDQTVRAEKITVIPDGDAFDATLEKVTTATPKTEIFTAATVVFEGIETIPPSSATSDAPDSQNSSKTPSWEQLSFDRVTARNLVNQKKGANVQTVTLEKFRGARFEKATISSIRIEDKDAKFTVEAVSAEQINIAELANLPRTLGGLIEWSHLNTGKAELRKLALNLANAGKLNVNQISIDGIKEGRLVRLNIADVDAEGGTEHPDISIKLKKIELNDFPIITDFPTTREEVISFQTRHKSLIYGGFDIRGFEVKTDDGGAKIDYATMPPPKFGNTPSGQRYISDATTRMKMSLDLGLFDKGKKPLDPAVLKLLGGGQLTLTVDGRSLMDHAKKTVVIPEMTISAPGSVSLKISAGVGNLPLRYFETPGDPLVQQIAMEQMTLVDLSLILINDGIAGRLFDAVSEREGIPRERVPQQLAAAARANLARDGSAEARAHADEIVKFLSNPKSLKLVMKPQRPISILTLANPQLLQAAGKVGKVLGLKLIANEGVAR